jgi:hypothetical protein
LRRIFTDTIVAWIRGSGEEEFIGFHDLEASALWVFTNGFGIPVAAFVVIVHKIDTASAGTVDFMEINVILH